MTRKRTHDVASYHGGGSVDLLLTRFRRALVAALVVALVLAIAPAWAVAAGLTWTGATSGDWATAGNWTPSQVPQTGDDLVLTLDGILPFNNNLVGVQLHSITLIAAANPVGTYEITGNAIVLQSGGSITSHHTSGLPDNVNVGVTLNGPATITLSGTQMLNFNGSITGTGGLTLVNNSGTDNQLRLTVANSYSGLTTFSGSNRVHALLDGAIPSSSAVVINSGGITFTTSATIGSLAGTGGLVTTLGAVGATTLTVGGNNTSTSYAGILQNGAVFAVGLTKVGSGTLTLSGANPYTGATTVNAGTLLVTGSTSAGSTVTVASGATLGGTGSVGGNVTAQVGARLAPGTSIGTLTMGSLTWHGATTFVPTALFELSNSDTTSDRMAISGALSEGAGSVLAFDFQGTGQAGIYTLATFASTTFDATDFSFTGLTPGLVGTFSIVGGNTLRFTVEAGPSRTDDFNSDLRADILWRNTTGAGPVAVWFMNGAALGGSSFVSNLATTWTALGLGDFDGDGEADILWRNVDGSVAVWLMNGAAVASFGAALPAATTWTVAGLGDFNGDGRTDILWRNDVGQLAIWLMNGTAVQSSALVGTVSTAWVLIGVGDFDGNGFADILWREAATGQPAVWLMNGTTLVASINLPGAGTTWAVEGIGDFNGDGTSDILWREAGGTMALWELDGQTPGTTSISRMHLIGSVPTNWAIEAVRDFDRDAHADILWREAGGTVAVWLMNRQHIVGNGFLATIPADWIPY